MANSLMDMFFASVQAGPTQQAGLKAAAVHVLPPLRDAIADGTVDNKATDAPAVYNWLMNETKFSEFSDKITDVTVQDVRAFFEKVVAEATPAKRAAELKANFAAMTEAEHIRLAKAMESALPAGMLAGMAAARGNQTLEESIRSLRDMVQDTSLPELTLALTTHAPKTDIIASGIHALLQQATPARLDALQEYIAENFEGASLGVLLKRGWLFAEALMTAAENGNYLEVNPAKGRAFARILKETLSTLEEGLEAVGFTVPPGLGQEITAALDPSAALRQVLAEKEANVARMGSTRSFTVRKSPVKMKPPQQP